MHHRLRLQDVSQSARPVVGSAEKTQRYDSATTRPRAAANGGIASPLLAADPLTQVPAGRRQHTFGVIRSELFGGNRAEQGAMDVFLRANPAFLPQVGGIDWSLPPGGASQGTVSAAASDPNASQSIGAANSSMVAARLSLGAAGIPASATVDNASLALAPGAPVTAANVRDYLTSALQARSGLYSNRNLGGPTNLALWTPAKLDQLQQGIATARQFYPNIPPQTLAKLIIAEGAQESTGDFSAGILPGQTDFSQAATNSNGLGFLQVTPKFAVQDFINYGTAIKAPDGSTVVDPKGPIDLANPAVNVALWAWYTHNAVAAGESMAEVALGHAGSPVTRDFGNAQWSWLGGPHNDRHDPSTAGGYQDYHDRIKDYFVQSGFGSAAEFEALLSTAVSGSLANTSLALSR